MSATQAAIPDEQSQVSDLAEERAETHADGGEHIAAGSPARLRLEGSDPGGGAEGVPEQGPVPDAAQKKRNPLIIRTLGQLAQGDFPEPAALITDHKGRLLVAATDPLLIHGDWRSGKTWLMLEMGISLATGRPLFGHFPVAEPKSVLYVGGEGTAASFSDRVRQLLEVRGLGRGDFARMFRFVIMAEQPPEASLHLDDERSVTTLIDRLRDDPPDILMIDPLANFMIGDETNDGMKLVVQQVRRITQALGSQVFLAHHNVKNSQQYDRPSKMARGGGALAAGMGVLSLEAKRHDDGWSVHIDSDPKEGAPIPRFTVRWVTADDDAMGRPRLARIELNTADELVLTADQQKVLAAIAGRPGGDPLTSIRGIAEAAGISHTTTQRVVQMLSKLGLIEKKPGEGYLAKAEAASE